VPALSGGRDFLYDNRLGGRRVSVFDIEEFDDGPLGRLALSRSAVDRATERRGDTAWLAEAWADPRSRVLVVRDSQALVRTVDGRLELVFVASAAMCAPRLRSFQRILRFHTDSPPTMNWVLMVPRCVSAANAAASLALAPSSRAAQPVMK